MKRIDDFETEELAAYLVGKHEQFEDGEIDSNDIEDLLFDKYGILLDGFQTLLSDLVPLITIAKSGITDKTYKGFAGESCWLVKREIAEE